MMSQDGAIRLRFLLRITVGYFSKNKMVKIMPILNGKSEPDEISHR